MGPWGWKHVQLYSVVLLFDENHAVCDPPHTENQPRNKEKHLRKMRQLFEVLEDESSGGITFPVQLGFHRIGLRRVDGKMCKPTPCMSLGVQLLANLFMMMGIITCLS